MNKPRLYIDLDGVLCDYVTARDRDLKESPYVLFPQSSDGFFENLEPIHGSIETFKKLQEHYDVWILTRPSVLNTRSYSGKAVWITVHLGVEVLEKTVMACDKSLLMGDYLIDDQTEHGQTEFEGEHIHFDTDKFPDWNSVYKYLVIDKFTSK